MSLFNLFRKAEKSVEKPVEPSNENIIDANLFVDNEAPKLNESSKKINSLSEFISADYGSRGFNDGYLYPNSDLMEANIRKLRSDFRKAIDQVIDQNRTEINELKLHLINTRGISDRLEESLNQKITQLENILHELDTQKILSVENEGIISGSINDYKIGFIKGLERFSQEKFIAGGTRLF